VKFRLRRNLPAGVPDPTADPNDHTPDQADDLFAPEFAVVGHGFSVFDVVRQTGPAAHLKARANTVANTRRLGLVIHVPDADHYSVLSMRGGIWIPSDYATGHGLGADDAELWLSTSTAGLITTTEPTDQNTWKLNLGSVIDANNIWWEVGPLEQAG
jgi:hypothetical protein